MAAGWHGLRARMLAGALVSLAVAACAHLAGAPPSPAVSSPEPAAPTPQRQPLLRVAMLGDVTTTNVWALFDRESASYWNYATQEAYWPRLFRFAPLSRQIEPSLAGEAEPGLVCEAGGCIGKVKLLPGLHWSDGSPLTAHDVAFTANTAMDFQLDLTWREAYDVGSLDYVEALDDTTVAFAFHEHPGVAGWQYGVLQGPVVNRGYWEPRITGALSLLPEEALETSVRELEDLSRGMQAQVESLGSALNSMAPVSPAYQDTAAQATLIQEELNSVNQKLARARDEYESELTEAQQALFALGNAGEPTLGPWHFKDRLPGEFENVADFSAPVQAPWFDRARYVVVPDEAAAVQALLHDEVDLVLSPAGLSPASVERLQAGAGITLMRSQTRRARFLVFNHADRYLADPALHRALACLLDPQALVSQLDGEAVALDGFTVDAFWRAPAAADPCQGRTAEARMQTANEILESAGYSWESRGAPGSDPRGLRAPDGAALPSFELLAPALEVDPERAEAAGLIARQARRLGLEVEPRLVDEETLLYAVYGSGGYDLALLGWQLSSYPSYLCAWFAAPEGNPFAYAGTGLGPACQAWERATGLQAARSAAVEVQSVLHEDLPFIPLFTTVRYDAYRNLRYPFPDLLDGLAGVYGATELAVPFP